MAKKKAKVQIPAGDAASGKAVFSANCASCHNLAGSGLGDSAPPLNGIIGKKAASSGFAYSKALKACGLKWTKENFFNYIGAPAKFLPGNQMAFSGIPDPQERADLIAYLQTTE